jgi:hypothetical protein
MRSLLSSSRLGSDGEKFSIREIVFFIEIQTQHLLLRNKILTFLILFLYFAKCLSYGFSIQSEVLQILNHKNAIYSVIESYYSVLSPLYLLKTNALPEDALFIFCVILTFFSLLLQLIIVILSIRKKMIRVAFLIYAYYRAIYFWLVFPYVTEYLLLPFICSNNMINIHNYGRITCNSDQFLPRAIIAGITLIINILFAYYSLMFTNKSVCLNKAKNVDKFGRLTSKMENQLFLHQLTQSFLCVLSVSPNLSIGIAMNLINMISYSYCFLYCWENLHIKSNRVLKAFSSFFAFTVIRSGLRVITLILANSGNLSTGFEFYAVLIMAPLVVKMVFMAFEHRIQGIYYGSAEELDNPVRKMNLI